MTMRRKKDYAEEIKKQSGLLKNVIGGNLKDRRDLWGESTET